MNKIYKIVFIASLICNYNFTIYDISNSGLPEQAEQPSLLLSLPIEIYERISEKVGSNLDPACNLYCVNKETRERSLIFYKKKLASFAKDCFNKLDYNLSNKIYEYLSENLMNNININSRYDSYLFVKRILLQHVFDIAELFNCSLANNQQITDLICLLQKREPQGVVINIKNVNISAFLLDNPKLYKLFLKKIIGKKAVFHTGLYKTDNKYNIRTICHADYLYYNKNCFKYLNLILKNQIVLEREPDLDILLATLVGIVIKVIQKSYTNDSNNNKSHNEILSDLYINNPEVKEKLLKALCLFKNLNLTASQDIIFFARDNLLCIADELIEVIKPTENSINSKN